MRSVSYTDTQHAQTLVHISVVVVFSATDKMVFFHRWAEWHSTESSVGGAPTLRPHRRIQSKSEMRAKRIILPEPFLSVATNHQQDRGHIGHQERVKCGAVSHLLWCEKKDTKKSSHDEPARKREEVQSPPPKHPPLPLGGVAAESVPLSVALPAG